MGDRAFPHFSLEAIKANRVFPTFGVEIVHDRLYSRMGHDEARDKSRSHLAYEPYETKTRHHKLQLGDI